LPSVGAKGPPFDRLAHHGERRTRTVLPSGAVAYARWEQMAKFRNVLVHGYVDVDPAIVRDVVENRLGDLEAFVSAIRARLP